MTERQKIKLVKEIIEEENKKNNLNIECFVCTRFKYFVSNLTKGNIKLERKRCLDKAGNFSWQKAHGVPGFPWSWMASQSAFSCKSSFFQQFPHFIRMHLQKIQTFEQGFRIRFSQMIHPAQPFPADSTVCFSLQP